MFRCAVCRENCWAKERVSSDSTACLIVIRAIQSPLRRFQLRGCESKWRCGHRNPSFMGSYMAVRDWWGAKIRWPRNQRDFARCSAFLEGLGALGPICFKWSTEGQEEKLWLLLRWLRSSRAYSFVTLPAHPKILFASQTVSVCIPDQPRQVRTIWIVIFVSRCSEKLWRKRAETWPESNGEAVGVPWAFSAWSMDKIS